MALGQAQTFVIGTGSVKRRAIVRMSFRRGPRRRPGPGRAGPLQLSATVCRPGCGRPLSRSASCSRSHLRLQLADARVDLRHRVEVAVVGTPRQFQLLQRRRLDAEQRVHLAHRLVVQRLLAERLVAASQQRVVRRLGARDRDLGAQEVDRLLVLVRLVQQIDVVRDGDRATAGSAPRCRGRPRAPGLRSSSDLAAAKRVSDTSLSRMAEDAVRRAARGERVFKGEIGHVELQCRQCRAVVGGRRPTARCVASADR